SRAAGFPADESAEETGVALDLLDMFLRVARSQKFKAGDHTSGVECDQEVIGSGITNDMVRLWRGGEQATDGVPAGIRDEVQAAVGITQLDTVGPRKKLAGQADGDGRTALRLAPACLLVNENNHDQQHAGAVQAQKQR